VLDGSLKVCFHFPADATAVSAKETDCDGGFVGAADSLNVCFHFEGAFETDGGEDALNALVDPGGGEARCSLNLSLFANWSGVKRSLFDDAVPLGTLFGDTVVNSRTLRSRAKSALDRATGSKVDQPPGINFTEGKVGSPTGFCDATLGESAVLKKTLELRMTMEAGDNDFFSEDFETV